MADIFPYYDFNKMNEPRKSTSNNGSEVPRRSFDKEINVATQKNVPKPKPRPKDSKNKTLIQDEKYSMPIQKPEYRNAPSVVARLMGMDSIPANRSTVIDANESKVLKQSKSNIYVTRKDPILDGSPRSAPFRQTKCNLLSYGNHTSINNNNSNNISNNKKKKSGTGLPPRQHPQEEVLQKFKKDFETWQASKVLEKTKSIIEESDIQKGKFVQILAQENLNKEKMAKYSLNQKKVLENEQIILPKIEVKESINGGGKNEIHDSNFEELSLNQVKEKRERSSSPTRIVILKPSFERKSGIQDSSFVSNSNSNKMDDFLEEVKERLRLEIEGKSSRNSFSTKQKDGKNNINSNSTDTKQIARDIAKQIRESVTREMDKKLTRSHPFKLQNYEPDFIKRDTREILSERLKNVLRKETGTERPNTGSAGTGTSTEPSRASFLVKRRERVKSMCEFPSIVNIENNINETRYKLDSTESINADMTSPRSLVRSFSVPISGTALRKLLLEDSNSNSNSNSGRYEKNETEVRKSRKDRHGFGLRSRVSNLRGKLFGKKSDSIKRQNSVEFYPLKVIKTIPSALVNCGNIQENHTEVPPSPTSISSSSHNEFSVLENNNSSPVSPLEVSSHASINSFADLSFKFPGASPTRQVDKVETKEAVLTEQSENNEIIEIPSPEKAYVKEILVKAGLYENKDDFAPRSLSFQIFAEMEEIYSKQRKESIDQDHEEINPDILVERKILFDLVNESMQTLYGPSRSGGTLSAWVRASGGLPGGRILDEIWEQMNIFCNPPMDEMQTIDHMVGRDVKLGSWISKLYEGKDALCKRVAFAIFAELMDEFLQEMGCILDK